MVKYQYLAKDSDGKSYSGVIEAENLQQFYNKIRQNNWYCLKVKDITSVGKDIGVTKKIKTKELVIFCRQFSSMLTSGVTIIRALDILYRQIENKQLKLAVVNMYEDIQKGQTLSAAMKNRGNYFPDLLISMVEAGEVSGKIDEVVQMMAEHYEKDHKLRNKVKNSMIYPIVLAVLSVIVVFVLLVFVMPTFFEMFKSSGTELPFLTKVLVGISDFLKNNWLYIGLVLIICSIMGKILMGLPEVKYIVDRFKLNIPIIGKLNKTIITARFSRTLSNLYSSGITITSSLQMSANVLGNLYIEKCLSNAIEDVKKGTSLSQALSKTGVFNQMFCSMVHVGEESGAIDTLLSKTATFFDEEADSAIQKLVSVFEPLMIIILAVIIGFIVIATISPIYSMYEKIR